MLRHRDLLFGSRNTRQAIVKFMKCVPKGSLPRAEHMTNTNYDYSISHTKQRGPQGDALKNNFGTPMNGVAEHSKNYRMLDDHTMIRHHLPGIICLSLYMGPKTLKHAQDNRPGCKRPQMPLSYHMRFMGVFSSDRSNVGRGCLSPSRQRGRQEGIRLAATFTQR